MATESGPATAAALIRRLRQESGLTQLELARRIGSTQSVISRLESDDYEGHSLSMLYRIATAVHRRIAVNVVGDELGLQVRERVPAYGAESGDATADRQGLSAAELDRLTRYLAERFGAAGVSRSSIDHAVRVARGGSAAASVSALRGAIRAGAGDVVADVREARRRRGLESSAP